jgi:hypothetical protein
MTARDLLWQWLEPRLDAPCIEWLHAQALRLEAGAAESVFHLAFGQVPRKVGAAARASLHATPAEQAQAAAFHPGWNLDDWTVEQAARASLLLSLPDAPESVATLLALHQTADLGEHVALTRALFLLPFATALLHVAREAIRSNMGDVFRAISQRNPYPAALCDNTAWNQMVAKCVFTDLPLRSVSGLDARSNVALAHMLLDLAEERHAAGRPFAIEAWRCIAPYAFEHADFDRGASVLRFLEAAFDAGDKHRRGAAVALSAAPGAAARALLHSKAPELEAAVAAGTLTWENYDV